MTCPSGTHYGPFADLEWDNGDIDRFCIGCGKVVNEKYAVRGRNGTKTVLPEAFAKVLVENQCCMKGINPSEPCWGKVEISDRGPEDGFPIFTCQGHAENVYKPGTETIPKGGSSMDIQEIRKLKKEMEDQVLESVRAFSKKTGLIVRDFSLQSDGAYDAWGEVIPETVRYSIKTEVKLL